MRIHSIFQSIDGEVCAHPQGSLTTFIRTAGCNLRCSWCDTPYAQDVRSGKDRAIPSIIQECGKSGLRYVTITGGEPLLQHVDLQELIRHLTLQDFIVVVETNGSYAVDEWFPVHWVVDYKLPSSGMEEQMTIKAFTKLNPTDFVKFVIKRRSDYDRALLVMERLKAKYCEARFAFSPVFNELDVNELVSWMKEDKVDGVLNAQLHKVLGILEEK